MVSHKIWRLYYMNQNFLDFVNMGLMMAPEAETSSQ